MTQTEKKYFANVGKLFYNTLRKKLLLVERLYKPNYGNAFKYEISYIEPAPYGTSFAKKITATTFCTDIGTRFIEIVDEKQYKELLDNPPSNILR